MKRIGFIGMGNMAGALARGFIASGKVAAGDIFAFAPHQDKLERNAASIGFTPCKSVLELLDSADVVVLACKPQQIKGVLDEIKVPLRGKPLLSVAAGWRHQDFVAALGQGYRIQCLMPNVAASVAEGVFLFEDVSTLAPDELSFAKELFGTLGVVQVLPTALMKIGMAITGCGPAFMDMIMEAYADAAVKWGIPRDTAYTLVAQTMKGSARLQLESKTHPAVLKDAVCSPGGATIVGVASLEASGLRGACISSIDAIMAH